MNSRALLSGLSVAALLLGTPMLSSGCQTTRHASPGHAHKHDGHKDKCGCKKKKSCGCKKEAKKACGCEGACKCKKSEKKACGCPAKKDCGCPRGANAPVKHL